MSGFEAWGWKFRGWNVLQPSWCCACELASKGVTSSFAISNSSLINDSPYFSLLTKATTIQLIRAPKTPGNPCKLCTPHVSWILNFEFKNGWKYTHFIVSSLTVHVKCIICMDCLEFLEPWSVVFTKGSNNAIDQGSKNSGQSMQIVHSTCIGNFEFWIQERLKI